MPDYGERLSTIVYRVNKLLKLQIQNSLRDFDITTDQWIVLGRVYHGSGQYNQKQLAEMCFKERAAITRMLDILQRKELLERRNSVEDRREFLIYITDKGNALYRETLGSVAKAEDRVSSILDAQELEEAIRLMKKLENSLLEK